MNVLSLKGQRISMADCFFYKYLIPSGMGHRNSVQRAFRHTIFIETK